MQIDWILRSKVRRSLGKVRWWERREGRRREGRRRGDEEYVRAGKDCREVTSAEL